MQVKSTNGVTLTMLIIVVAVMVILAGVTIYYGSEEIEKSKEEKLLSEVQIVNQAVYQSYINYTKTKNASYIVGQVVAKIDASHVASKMGVTLINIPNTYDEKLTAYYRLTPANLEKIGVEGAEDIYIVNYLTGEVMNETQIKTKTEKPLYTYSVNNFNQNGITSF